MAEKLPEIPSLKSVKSKPEGRNFWNKHKVLTIVLLSALFGCLFLGWLVFHSPQTISVIIPKSEEIKKTNGRINVLLLGNAGGAHDGPDLTDSIIVASFDEKTRRVVMISIPRDLWLDNIQEKINATYAVGKLRHNDGLNFAADKIDDILGVPIHYVVRIDFNGFAKAVDLVGGLEVNVEKSFDDYEYPIAGKENDMCELKEEVRDITPEQAKSLNLQPGQQNVLVDTQGQIATNTAEFGCRYEHIRFNKGLVYMNGETALKYVRSRHGTNGEGSDFARSKRQQLVIEAFKSKAFSLELLSNPQKIFGLIDTFGKSFETNIPKDRWLEFYGYAKEIETTDSVVLGDLGEGQSVLINPPVGQYGAWVLTPPNNDFTLIQQLIKAELDNDQAAIDAATRSAQLK